MEMAGMEEVENIEIPEDLIEVEVMMGMEVTTVIKGIKNIVKERYVGRF